MASLSSQTVIVSYSASPGFLSSSSWPQIQQALCAQFPLRNIHWKSATRTSLRTIQQLDVSLANLDTIRDEHASQIPGNLLEKPLLNIYLACCEDNDVDTYRTNIKRHAKEWHASVSTRKNQEWLIIQVVKQDAKTPGGAFFQLKGSVLDKLRSDFNTDKRERCVQLTWSSAQDSPIVWGEIMNKWKDGLLSAFESALTQREDEVKRSESQRQMPGWNFCTFFILKESLASSFYSMNLLSEALLQYDELEASFFQVLKEKNLSWFGTLITPTPRDDSGALLSISRKPYRDLILANTISVFDFRIYLLARQCEILARMNRLPDVSRRCVAFLGAFGRRLREVQDTLPKFFIESWTYTSSLSVVDQCTTWEADLSPDKSQINAIFAGKGELLELARTQLDILGIESTHLPPTPPFCHAVPSSDFPNSSSSSGEISNKDLLQALKDPEAFYELYIVTTNRAIDLYRKAGRRKFALKLHGSLASLDIHRGRFDAALTTYTSLPGHYAHKWSSLEGLMLSLALDNHEALQRPKGGEWIHLMLSFLATYMDHGTELLLSKEDALAYLRELISAMWDAATKLEQNLVHTDHPAISVKVASDARLQPGRDGLLLDVVILNRLPCDIPIQDVRVILAGADNVRLQFTASCDVLRSGRNELTLSCLASSPGSYLLDSSEILMSKIIFKWQSRKDGTKNKSKGKLHLVRVPKDYQALSVQIRQPKLVALGKRSSVLVVIKTGRNDVDTMSLNITSPSITFHLEETELDGVSEVELTKTDTEVTLKSVPNNSEVTLRVTHTDVVGPTMKITVHVQYLTKAESTVTRDISVTQTVLVTLPISVNVEDFFRGTRLFSRFTVSTTTHQHVRVASTSLQCEEGDSLKIVSCNAKGRGIMSVTPAQPAHFLFYIDSTGPVRQPLTLRVRYRMLREEVHSLIEEAVDSLDSSYQRDVLVELVVQALESDATWIDQYGLTGEVILPERSLDGLENKESLERLKQMLASTDKDISACGIWREMLIPVDVPSMNIVASVHMDVPTKTPVYKFYAGQPISATLSIHTSFRWDASDNKDRVYQMEYDVEEIVRDWLVSGRKRGDFIAVDDGTFTVPLTLIALHHGELAMPKVLVSALPSGGPMTMGSLSIPSTETYQNHGAEKILVLPRGGRTTFVTEMG